MTFYTTQQGDRFTIKYLALMFQIYNQLDLIKKAYENQFSY